MGRKSGATLGLSSHPRKKKSRATDEINTRCSPRRFMKLIGQLDDDKKAAVNAIGFGGLLHLEITKIRHQMCRWLMDHLDPDFARLELREGCFLQLEEEDVERVFGIPSTGDAVKLSGNDDAVMAWGRALEDLPDDSIVKMDLSYMEKKLTNLQAGPQFQQFFVLYTHAIILTPRSRLYANTRLLHSLMDVEMIRTYNWGAYILESLLKGVKQFKTRHDCYVNGSLLFLQMIYLDRVNIRRPLVTRARPSIKGWTDKYIDARIAAAYSAGGFHRGDVVDPFEPHLEAEPDLPPSTDPKIRDIMRRIELRNAKIKEHLAAVEMLVKENARYTYLLAALQSDRRRQRSPTPNYHVDSPDTGTSECTPIRRSKATPNHGNIVDYNRQSTSSSPFQSTPYTGQGSQQSAHPSGPSHTQDQEQHRDQSVPIQDTPYATQVMTGTSLCQLPNNLHGAEVLSATHHDQGHFAVIDHNQGDGAAFDQNQGNPAGCQSRRISTSDYDDGVDRKMGPPAKFIKIESSMEDAIESESGVKYSEGESSTYCKIEAPRLELEAQISRLERLIADLKAKRRGNKF